MEKFQDLLRGLIERSQGDSPTGAAAAQLQWVHGFGGMGKSWYLRKAYIDAQKHILKIRVALVDWAHTDWRDPLNDHPKTPEDLMEPIAVRLAQLAGIEAIQPFREAKLRVSNARQDRHRLLARFKEQMDRLQREGNTDDVMLQLLYDESLRSDDKDEQKRLLDELRANRVEYDTLFGTWCQSEAVEVSDLDAASRPTNLLLDGLVRSIRKSANEMPLLLMLDTCEVISHRPHLEYWLRRIVSQLCDGKTPILIQIVSRLKPDAGTVPGRRKGWSEISDRLVSVVDFNADNCLLSRAEIEHGLRRLEPKVDETQELSKQVFQVTLGVPLAVGSLFDMHLDQSNVLQELGSFDSEKHSLNETEAVRKVIEEVSGRMLLHLHESERPESEEDLRSIVALALLPSLDEEVLSRFWDCKPWKRLLDLASRYSLLAGGDLHLRVREYLRRYWRDGYRPDCFDQVLDTLAQILEQLPKAEDQAFGSESWMISRMRQLNLSFWQEGWKAKDQAARLLAVALAYDEKVPELADLILEFADSDTGGRKLAQHLQAIQSRARSPYENSVIRSWLSQSEALTSWSELESACLKIGIELVEKAKIPDDYIEKFLRLEASVQRFDNMDAPYRDLLASSYFTIGYEIWPDTVDSPIVTDSHAVSWQQAVEAAYRRSIDFEPRTKHAWNNLGNLFQDHLNRFEESEQAYRKAIELDEKYALPWNG
ncbi:MAG: tetratricopeptide repeat protein, partial [Planctomycetota bacterium]